MSRINIKTRYWSGLLVIGAIAALMTLVLPALTAGGADHLDAPLVQADGRTDINDVFAFSNGSNTVLVMTVNPLAGVLSPTGKATHPGGLIVAVISVFTSGSLFPMVRAIPAR